MNELENFNNMYANLVQSSYIIAFHKYQSTDGSVYIDYSKNTLMKMEIKLMVVKIYPMVLRSISNPTNSRQ